MKKPPRWEARAKRAAVVPVASPRSRLAQRARPTSYHREPPRTREYLPSPTTVKSPEHGYALDVTQALIKACVPVTLVVSSSLSRAIAAGRVTRTQRAARVAALGSIVIAMTFAIALGEPRSVQATTVIGDPAVLAAASADPADSAADSERPSGKGWIIVAVVFIGAIVATIVGRRVMRRTASRVGSGHRS